MPRQDPQKTTADVAAPAQAPSRLLAFADESMRRVDEVSLVYFIASAVVPEDRCDDVRDSLRPLLRGRSQKIHWRDEKPAGKERIAKAIAAARVESLLVFGAMIDPRNQERARAQVLKSLLFELDQRHVSHAVLESRHPERDRFDLKSIGRFRNGGYISRRLTVSHGKPVQEPMLWVPDAVAGAAGDHHCGATGPYELLADLVTTFDVGHLT